MKTEQERVKEFMKGLGYRPAKLGLVDIYDIGKLGYLFVDQATFFYRHMLEARRDELKKLTNKSIQVPWQYKISDQIAELDQLLEEGKKE